MLSNIDDSQAKAITHAMSDRAERNFFFITAEQFRIILGGCGGARGQRKPDQGARLVGIVGDCSFVDGLTPVHYRKNVRRQSASHRAGH